MYNAMKTNIGFTLIEVLIAMLILAVGLLGLAALQTYTLRSNLAAYNHGQATQLLYDMADRMRANHCKPSTDTPPTFTCNYPTYASAANAYITTNSNTYAQGKSLNTACTTTTGCNPSALAGNDLIEWNNAIVATLPMGRGMITSTDNDSIFVLSITWDDDRNGAVDSNDPIFTMSLQL
jgi:type IV pilus assembly protein PilV